MPFTAAHAAGYDFATGWGSYGTGDRRFLAPSSMAVDGLGNVYVADGGANRYTGRARSRPRVKVFDSAGRFLRAWGEYGSGKGQFLAPTELAADVHGNVYVADRGSTNCGTGRCGPCIWRIQKFTSMGRLIANLGRGGDRYRRFVPRGLAVGADGTLYALDDPNPSASRKLALSNPALRRPRSPSVTPDPAVRNRAGTVYENQRNGRRCGGQHVPR